MGRGETANATNSNTRAFESLQSRVPNALSLDFVASRTLASRSVIELVGKKIEEFCETFKLWNKQT